MSIFKRKSIVIVTILIIVAMLLSLNTTQLYADDTLTGTYNSSQTLTVDTTGKYYFKIAGEQGGSTANFSGGKGGIVGFEMTLNAGDILTLEVDSGAGTGTLTNGGGQSALYLNNVLVAVAGGGGGATETVDGGHGGLETSGTTNVNFIGESDSRDKTAGGGAGYRGGNAGLDHEHVGNTTSGGECYQNPVYHIHTGNAASGGGCYTKPVYHSHTNACNSVTVCGSVYTSGEKYMGHSCGGGCVSYYNWIYYCSGCGAEVGWRCGGGGNSCGRSGGQTGGSHTKTSIACGKTAGSTIEYYNLGCGKVATGNNGHVHSGNTLNGGACYRTPVLHTHSEYCNRIATCGTVYKKETRYVYDGSCSKWCSSWYKDYYTCSGCGAEVGWRCSGGGNSCGAAGGITSGIHTKGGTLGCGMTEQSAEFWLLSCTELESIIEGYTFSCTKEAIQAKGGSNYTNDHFSLDYISSYGESVVDDMHYIGNSGAGYIEITKDERVILDVNKPANANYDVEIADEHIKLKLLNGTNLPEYLPTPALYGFDFQGWFTSATGGTQVNALDPINLENQPSIYAQWTPRSVQIGLNTNNVHADALDEEFLTRDYNSPFNTPTPHSIYHDFLGWYTEETGGVEIKTTDLIHYTRPATEDDHEYLDETFNLYAHWKPTTIQVTFDATTNGGILSGNNKTTVDNGSSISYFPTASKSNCTFVGWFTSPDGGDQYNTSTEVWIDNSVGSMTLYARFEANNSVVFPYTGGVQTYTIPQNGFYRLEAYGAQGGDSNGYSGGRGGYTAGVRYFQAGETIYVYVGGKAATFNGGGTAQSGFGAGGGATDFRYGGSSLNNRILISGGGGGATSHAHGYPGGGTSNAGNNGTAGSGSSGQIGGGGGYVGGAAGQFVQHWCSPKDTNPCYQLFTGTRSVYKGCTGTVRYVGDGNYRGNTMICTYGCTFEKMYPHHQCNKCGGGWHMGNPGPCPNGRWTTESYRYWSKTCPYYSGQILVNTPGSGGSNYVDSGMYLQQDKAGIQGGNGLAKITLMYTVLLDANKPLESNEYTANATNIAFIDIADTVLKEEALPYTTPNYTRFETTGQSGRQTWALLITERNTSYGKNDKLPVPSLKGWKFTGWYTEPQLDKGVKVTDASTTRINDTTKQLDNHILYAHWEPEVYYIKYYKNNTSTNVYGDSYTNPNAVFDTSLTGAFKNTNAKYRYDSVEDCYIQTVKYDHDIEVLPNYYAKTGYYFKNWSNKSDTTLTGTKGTGTGTGKQTGTTYQESTILKPIKNGENFQTLKGNFNYITNEKALSSGTEDTPVWAYGDQTVIFYATWEPIKYSLRFNGTDNWNNSSSFTTGTHTAQDSYLQKVTNAAGAQDTKIRYDQTFNLDANLFEREAPHTITSEDGLSVVLKSGYGYIGWGFGKDTMKYSSNPSYKLLSMNTEHDPEQALTSDSDTLGRDYEDKQSNVINVISEEGINKLTKYISDWSNARTDNNRKDKSTIENNVIESNLHAIWRRESNIPPGPNDHNCYGDNCTCPDDGNGHCVCTTPGTCPDTDNDGVCDCHDSSINPTPPGLIPPVDDNCYGDNCPCPDDGNGHCVCYTPGVCPDSDGDGVCNCHDSSINPTPPDDVGENDNGNCYYNNCPCQDDGNGHCVCYTPGVCPDTNGNGKCDCHEYIDSGPADDPDNGDYGITLTFDLNGGYINKNNKFYYSPIVLKQELFNDYYYEFDIIGNINKDHLNHTAVIDAYGAYSNTSTPSNNYNASTGVNKVYHTGDGLGGVYRLSGWSTNKGAIYPDYAVTIDGIKNINLDTFDAPNNANTIKICNDTVLYAVWEPVLQMNAELTNTVTNVKAKSGTLTDASQENMQRNGLPTLAIKPGQGARYIISLRGENKATVGDRHEPINLTVEFDELITGIYDIQNKNLHDNLNQISSDDIDDPYETMTLNTTNLNRQFIKQTDSSIIRQFNLPLYLGTDRATESGYPSFKEDGYTLNITASRPSNFHKGDEVVTAKFILDISGRGSDSGNDGSGGSGGNSGGGGGTGSNLPSSTVGEFRTNIRMK